LWARPGDALTLKSLKHALSSIPYTCNAAIKSCVKTKTLVFKLSPCSKCIFVPFWAIPWRLSSNCPMNMEPTLSSETSAIRTQTAGNYPKRNKLQFLFCIDVVAKSHDMYKIKKINLRILILVDQAWRCPDIKKPETCTLLNSVHL